jgi:hypothetical protein
MLRHIASLLMFALAALSIAAIWSIVSMISGGQGAFVAPVCGAVIGGLTIVFGWRRGLIRGLLASLMMMLCIGYQSFLFAAGTIAGLMGLSLSEAIHSMGVDLTLSMIRAHTQHIQLWMYALALIIAFVLGCFWDRKTAKATS